MIVYIVCVAVGTWLVITARTSCVITPCTLGRVRSALTGATIASRALGFGATLLQAPVGWLQRRTLRH